MMVTFTKKENPGKEQVWNTKFAHQMFWEHLLRASGGVQNMSPQDTPLWNIDDFELKVLEKQLLQEGHPKLPFPP